TILDFRFWILDWETLTRRRFQSSICPVFNLSWYKVLPLIFQRFQSRAAISLVAIEPALGTLNPALLPSTQHRFAISPRAALWLPPSSNAT
ncbi:MAG TPA: hypothetical protein V6C65_15195, partial [Allocoleopsis sp.]